MTSNYLQPPIALLSMTNINKVLFPLTRKRFDVQGLCYPFTMPTINNDPSYYFFEPQERGPSIKKFATLKLTNINTLH